MFYYYNVFNKLTNVIFFVLILLPSFLFSEVKTGVINITEKDNINFMSLDGEWEFYWEMFISPGASTNSSEYLKIPGSWTDFNKHPSWGYGSLRIIIKDLKPGIYSLYLPDMASNYKLYLNGTLYSECGVIGRSREETTPQFLPKTLSFYADGKDIELLIHISNFNYRVGGIWRSIFIGSDQSIRNYNLRKIIPDILVIGVLFAVSLFHIGIYLFRRKEKSELIFGVLCITLAFRVISTGEQLLTILLPNFSWEILRRLEYSPFYLSVPLFVLLMSKIFPKEKNIVFNKIIYILSIFFGLAFIFLPIRISNNIILPAQGLVILTMFNLIWLMYKVIRLKRLYSILFSVAYGIFFITAINDILFANMVIRTGYLVPIGFIFSIIGQSLILTRKFIHSITQTEILAESRDKFRQDSITDGLTGLYNSRYLYKILETEVAKHHINKDPLTFLMADVDNFKIFNDTYGHTQGDKVLKKIAEVIRKSARDLDIPCRYGGEEFSIILPNTPLLAGKDVAERIRTNFEILENEDKKFNGITISIGVSLLKENETVNSLIERADTALYSAKNSGKNKVVLSK